MVVLAFFVAPLRIASIGFILPLLKVLLRKEWAEELTQQAAQTWSWIRPVAVATAEFLAAQSSFAALAWICGAMLTLSIVRALLLIAQERLASHVVQNSVQSIALEVHESLLQGAAAAQPEGEIVSYFTTDL